MNSFSASLLLCSVVALVGVAAAGPKTQYMIPPKVTPQINDKNVKRYHINMLRIVMLSNTYVLKLNAGGSPAIKASKILKRD